MEQYTTFLLPQFVDIRMLIVWIAVAASVIFLLIFFLWKTSPQKWYPNVAGTFVILAIVLIPLAHFGGPFYNDKMMADAVANDYKVTVSALANHENLIVVNSGKAYTCRINSADQIRYYVLCDVTEGKVLLDEITAGKFGK